MDFILICICLISIIILLILFLLLLFDKICDEELEAMNDEFEE